MIKENMKFEDLMKLKGMVTVELFNAKTGKLESRVQKENFIAVGNKKWWARQQRNSIIDKMPNELKDMVSSNEQEAFPSADRFFNRIYLTTDNSEENPESEWYLRGDLVGAIDITGITTSTHEKAGVLNVNESFIDREKIHIVGDFGTDRGNGTFQSIGFVSLDSQYANSYNTYYNYVRSYLGFAETLDYKGQGNGDNLITKLGNKLIYSVYATSSDNSALYYFDLEEPESGMQKLFTPDASFQRTGLTNDGQNIFISQNGYTIREYQLDGTLKKTITTEIPNLRGIYFDIGENVFYVTSSNSAQNPIAAAWNSCMYKLDKNTGEILEILQFIRASTSYRICGRLADGAFIFTTTGGGTDLWIQDFARDESSFYVLIGVSSSRAPGIVVDGNIFYGIAFLSEANYHVTKIHPAAMNSRVLLPAPQTKTNAQTMKVTYDLHYTDWTKL